MEGTVKNLVGVLCHEGNSEKKVLNLLFRVIEKDSVECIMNEKRVLSNLKHPFLVNIKYAFQDKPCLYLIMDYLKGADLRYHICYR